jgi:hypothetical protein
MTLEMISIRTIPKKCRQPPAKAIFHGSIFERLYFLELEPNLNIRGVIA